LHSGARVPKRGFKSLLLFVPAIVLFPRPTLNFVAFLSDGNDTHVVRLSRLSKLRLRLLDSPFLLFASFALQRLSARCVMITLVACRLIEPRRLSLGRTFDGARLSGLGFR
jgi:hypothetical protein